MESQGWKIPGIHWLPRAPLIRVPKCRIHRDAPSLLGWRQAFPGRKIPKNPTSRKEFSRKSNLNVPWHILRLLPLSCHSSSCPIPLCPFPFPWELFPGLGIPGIQHHALLIFLLFQGEVVDSKWVEIPGFWWPPSTCDPTASRTRCQGSSKNP